MVSGPADESRVVYLSPISLLSDSHIVITHITPFRMMPALLRLLGDAVHKLPCLLECLELEFSLDPGLGGGD